MSYTRVNWKDYPTTTTPITADNLNIMDEGIDDLDSRVGSTDISESGTSVTAAIKNIKDALGDQVTFTLDGTELTITTK